MAITKAKARPRPATTAVAEENATTEVAAAPKRPPISVGAKGIELKTFEDIHRFAQAVVASKLTPKGMEDPATVLIAVQMGMEIGLAPMQALQNIAVINGRPCVWGDSVKALVESSGLCVDFREGFDGEQGKGDKWNDAYAAVCHVRRRGRENDVICRFSVADAKTAGLWGKAGPWTQYPKRMLQMRARAFACRDAFPDVLKGLHIAEEAQDIVDVTPDESVRMKTLVDATEAGETLEPEICESVQEDSPEPKIGDLQLADLQYRAKMAMDRAPEEMCEAARAQVGAEMLAISEFTKDQLVEFNGILAGA